MANKDAKGTQQQEKVIESVSKTEQFYNENKKLIWGCLIGIVVIGLAILGYRKFIYEPKAAEAAAQMFPAENSFINGEFQLALDGDGNNMGLRDIISEYGNKAGKAVYLYAGLSALNLQQYDEAIKYLKKYKAKDNIMTARARPPATGFMPRIISSGSALLPAAATSMPCSRSPFSYMTRAAMPRVAVKKPKGAATKAVMMQALRACLAFLELSTGCRPAWAVQAPSRDAMIQLETLLPPMVNIFQKLPPLSAWRLEMPVLKASMPPARLTAMTMAMMTPTYMTIRCITFVEATAFMPPARV